MARRILPSPQTPVDVAAALAGVRAELGVPAAFPPEVLAAADVAADRPPSGPGRADRTDLPLVTIDPPGSRDLDQALHLQRTPGGYRVHYAIADVAAFVAPGGAVDAETHRRGVTLYGPDGATLLHPPRLAHDAASLLPDQDRPALLWTFELGADGEVASTDLTRAVVRSRARLAYAQVQSELDAGRAAEPLVLLREVGLLREQLEAARGGASLSLPEQVVVLRGDGYGVELRGPVRVEDWNAQVSLLTGMAAARLMLDAGVGILRTLPEPAADAVERLRRTAVALDVDWPAGVGWAQRLRTLDAGVPAEAALLTSATQLFRGAGYLPVDSGAGTARDVGHAGLAAPYAHVTAPLRRLVDRYAGEVCLAVVAGHDVPGWVQAALPALPSEMAGADRRAAAYERACIDLIEACALAGRVGEVLDGVVVDVSDGGRRGVVQTTDPAVLARVDGVDVPLGERVRVRVVRADVPERTVRFELVAA